MSKPNLRVVRAQAGDSAQIFLYGVIGDFWYCEDPLTARRFQQQLNALSDVNEIHVHINSPGGDVLEGLAIANTILSSKKSIHTHNDGVCASMASVILASAKKGNRHAAKGSLTMFHSASTISWGNAAQLRDDADMLEKHDEVLAEIIADAMGKTMEEIKSMYFDGNDHWLTAKELEADGFITIDTYDAEDMPENATALKYDKVAAFYRAAPKAHAPINNNENMITINKFKSLTNLAKVAAGGVTAELVQAVNDEISAENIPDVTLVLDSELKKVSDEAEKVPGLVAAADADKKKIDELEGTIKDLNAKLGKPATDAIIPPAGSTDSTAADGAVTDEFETSYDREIKAKFGK